MVSGAADSKVRVHDVIKNETTHVFNNHVGRVKRLATAPNIPFMFWSGAEDGHVLLVKQTCDVIILIIMTSRHFFHILQSVRLTMSGSVAQCASGEHPPRPVRVLRTQDRGQVSRCQPCPTRAHGCRLQRPLRQTLRQVRYKNNNLVLRFRQSHLTESCMLHLHLLQTNAQNSGFRNSCTVEVIR